MFVLVGSSWDTSFGYGLRVVVVKLSSRFIAGSIGCATDGQFPFSVGISGVWRDGMMGEAESINCWLGDGVLFTAIMQELKVWGVEGCLTGCHSQV